MAFRGKQLSMDIVKFCTAKAAEFHFLVQVSSSHAQKIQRSVFWSKPSVGWFKLNSDASVLPSSGRAGGSGLLSTLMVLGFKASLGLSVPLMSSLRSFGLQGTD